MTRISIIKREAMNADQARVYDEVEKAGGPLGGPYWAYIRNPRLMRIAQDMGTCLRASALSGRERQIAVLTTVRHWGARYPWAAQVRASLAVGVDQGTIDAINAGKTPTLSSAREKMAQELARELLANHGLAEATYAAAAKLFSEEELVALVATVGQFSMVCCTANAFDITPAEGAPALLPA
jgi:4-carboxymuconolactone decarboxylase